MQTLSFKHTARSRLPGKKDKAIIGVVASGNLEVLLERVIPGAECEVDIATPLTGYDETWKAVIDDFVEWFSPGGLRISINDGGARTGYGLSPPDAGLRTDEGRVMEDTATRRQVGWFRCDRTATCGRACWIPSSFTEFIGDHPSVSRARTVKMFDLPSAFDDGVIVRARQAEGKGCPHRGAGRPIHGRDFW